MARQLAGKRIAFLATEGVEQVELEQPLQAVREAGGNAELVSLESGEVQAFNHLDKADRAVAFVRAFFEQDKPVAVICHGPWTLVEAGVLAGRTITSWPSLATDIRNAGGTWVDEEAHVDNGLVSSRKPDDLPAFCAKLIEEFAEGRHSQAA